MHMQIYKEEHYGKNVSIKLNITKNTIYKNVFPNDLYTTESVNILV